jgi:hypothetical protein
MSHRNLFLVLLAGLALALSHSARAQSAGTPWRLTGDLSEACSCSVPCTCNFGANPSPHMFCYAIFSLDIKEGHYGDLKLDGLRMAGANGPKGVVWYLDDRATKEQAGALRAIGMAIGKSVLKANGIADPKKAPPEYRFRGFQTARIDQVVTDRKNSLKIGDAGSFEGNYITGLDGKTPVVVENNWSWNIQHGIKAKTTHLSYHDVYGNAYDFKDTNSNQGTFDWSDTTPIYFR